MGNLYLPHKITVHGDFVYWSDLFFGAIYRVNKNTGEGRETLYQNRDTHSGHVYDLKVYNPDLQTTCKYLMYEQQVYRKAMQCLNIVHKLDLKPNSVVGP